MAAALEKLPKQKKYPHVLVGYNSADDAGVVKLNESLALVQTVDFFTPIVDDPYMYGQISAANSLSDIYAMGGKPFSALNIVGFPKNIFPIDILSEILRGGQDKAEEADTVIVGGHTISDDELKYGLAVTGLIHPDKIMLNNTARHGDVLILTKAIGTGTITTALKAGKGTTKMIKRVTAIMTQLNKTAAEICTTIGVNSCTDISGFGLIGHALEMVQGSGVSIELQFDNIPVIEDAWLTMKNGHIPGGTRANHLYTFPNTTYSSSILELDQLLLNDPQTSGGLLISVSEKKTNELIKQMSNEGIVCSIVGTVNKEFPGRIKVQ